MNRERILWTSVLVLALATFGGVYQFYFKEKLASYASHVIVKKNAEDAYKNLVDKFEGANPDEVIRLWREVVQPWKESVIERGKYFDDGGWREHEKPADDVPILKFWYTKELQTQFTKLYTEFSQTPGLVQYPPYEQLIKEFRVRELSDFPNGEMQLKDVNQELSKVAFGMQVCRMMMKAKTNYLSHVFLWSPRETKEQDGLIRLWTIGLDFGMDMKTLTNFVDNTLRTSNRYFTLEGIKIQYPYVGYDVEPVLRVQMLLTTATFVEAKSGTGDTEEGSATSGNRPGDVVNRLGLNKNAPPPPPEPTGFQKVYRWFLSLYGF